MSRRTTCDPARTEVPFPARALPHTSNPSRISALTATRTSARASVRVTVGAAPPWLAHALRAQRGPVPRSAVVRGALAAGPLLLAAVASGRTSPGVLAAIAAMLAGINDRPGSRRASIRRIGVPALAGALGLAVGTYGGQWPPAVPLTLALTLLGLVAGSLSAAGPVASGAGTQLLVTAAVGAGMPLPESGWQRALAFLAGAGWLLGLRLALPTPGAPAGDFRFDGERHAVAGVCDAVADLLDAAGTHLATARRAALTAALDHAQDSLDGPRLRRPRAPRPNAGCMRSTPPRCRSPRRRRRWPGPGTRSPGAPGPGTRSPGAPAPRPGAWPPPCVAARPPVRCPRPAVPNRRCAPSTTPCSGRRRSSAGPEPRTTRTCGALGCRAR